MKKQKKTLQRMSIAFTFCIAVLIMISCKQIKEEAAGELTPETHEQAAKPSDEPVPLTTDEQGDPIGILSPLINAALFGKIEW